jgi:hypothetical protein
VVSCTHRLLLMFGDVAMRLRFPAFRVFLASAIAVFWVSAVQIAAAQSSNDPDILAAYVYRYADYYLPFSAPKLITRYRVRSLAHKRS